MHRTYGVTLGSRSSLFCSPLMPPLYCPWTIPHTQVLSCFCHYCTAVYSAFFMARFSIVQLPLALAVSLYNYATTRLPTKPVPDVPKILQSSLSSSSEGCRSAVERAVKDWEKKNNVTRPIGEANRQLRVWQIYYLLCIARIVLPLLISSSKSVQNAMFNF